MKESCHCGHPSESGPKGQRQRANQNSLAAAFRYILCQPRTREGPMSPENSQKVWIPVCCGRVMRFNRFLKPDGDAYGSMGCPVFNKNIVLEQENAPATHAYRQGTGLLTAVGTPNPPKTDRPNARDALSRLSAD